MTEFHASGQRVRLRLFMEGIELPVISAQVSGTPNSPSMGTIQIPPLVEGTRLLPRTLVHLFFFDAYASTNPYLLDSEQRGKVVDPIPVDPTVIENDDARQKNATSPASPVTIKAVPCGLSGPTGNRGFKLLFGGEMVGFSWSKNPTSRSLVLQCEDFSNYWDYAYQWNNTGIFGPGMKAVFSGGATNLFTDFLSDQGSAIVGVLLQGRCNSFPRLRGLAAGIVRLIEAIGGSYYTRPTDEKGNSQRRFAGQNIFFSLAELRLHITQMIAAYEDDPTSRNLLARQGYDGMFNRALGGLGQQVSIRKAINAITRIMFHETYPQPCPYYKPGKGAEPSGTRRVKVKNDPLLSVFAGTAEGVSTGLGNLLNDISALKESTQNGLIRVDRSVLASYKSTLIGMRKELSSSIAEMRGVNAPPILSSIFSQANKALFTALNAVNNWRPGLQSNNYYVKNFEPKLLEAQQQLRRIPELAYNTVPLKQLEPARLVQQILRPDIWFGAPPRCNVLFPDMYDSIAYRRMFLHEPTRFLLKTNDEFFGEDFLFDRFYFAPQAGSPRSDSTRLSEVMRGEVMDHELFTGILPVFEKMGEANIFAARSNRDNQGGIAKVSFAQRSANFLYFKHRFNARQFQVSCRFNPYIAVGFPGLIIDRWVDRGAVERVRQLREQFVAADEEARMLLLPKYTAELIGTNFLANFTEVTHSLSQSQLQGNTSIRCTYARQPSERVEFLGIAERAQSVQRRQDGDATRATDVAAVTPPPLYALGPNQGRIVGRRDVTDKYVATSVERFGEPGYEDALASSGKRLPVFFSGTSRAGGSRPIDVRVPVGIPVSLDNMTPGDWARLTEFLGETPGAVTFRAYAVEEEVPRYKLEEVDLPAEELIRPGWYGDIWSPAKISAVYKDFFGIGAVTEATSVIEARGGTVGAVTEKLAQAVDDAADGEAMDDAVTSLPVVTSLEEGSSIEQSVEFLLLTYSYVKQAGLDADEFIKAYTWRPIATLTDMFGTEGLAFNENGTEVTSLGEVEGFHSRAFGPYDDVFGLVGPELENIVGIERGSLVAQKGDVRKRRHEAVSLLRAALNFSRAQLG